MVNIGFVTLLFVLCFAVTFWQLGFVGAALAQNIQAYTPKDSPFNKSFADWAVDWWNRQTSLPAVSHPRDHYTPEGCRLFQGNETGPVWFLPDGTNRIDNSVPEVRECDVPAGKALMIQIAGSGCSEGEGYLTDEEKYNCAVWKPALDNIRFYASVDNVKVLDTDKNPGDKQRVYLEPVKGNLTYVANSPYTKMDRTPVEAGSHPAMVAGYFLMLPPLPPGEHELNVFENAIGSLADPTDWRVSNIQYNLKVK